MLGGSFAAEDPILFGSSLGGSAFMPLAPLISSLDAVLSAIQHETAQTTNACTVTLPSLLQHRAGAGDAMGSGVGGASTARPGSGRTAATDADHRTAVAAREQTLRRQLAEVQRRANVAVEAKDEQLRRMRLASRVDVFGRRTLEAVRRLRRDCAELRQGVRTLLAAGSSALDKCVAEIAAASERTLAASGDIVTAARDRTALAEVVSVLPDLLVPTLYPEFAMGYHPWPYAERSDPLRAFCVAEFGYPTAQRLNASLRQLHDVFVEVQRFGMRMHQLPDVHKPHGGLLLHRVAYGLLRDPLCPQDAIGQVRQLSQRDDVLARQQARLNVAIHGCVIRRKVLLERLRSALRAAWGREDGARASGDGLLTLPASATGVTPRAPLSDAAFQDDSKLAAFAVALAAAEARRTMRGSTHADVGPLQAVDGGDPSDGYGAHVIAQCARVQQFEQEAAALRARKSLVASQRAANARHMFQLWRTTGVDITKGRHAVVARDPDAPWTAGLVKLRGRHNGPSVEIHGPLSPFTQKPDDEATATSVAS
jgi:hypothetical protein